MKATPANKAHWLCRLIGHKFKVHHATRQSDFAYDNGLISTHRFCKRCDFAVQTVTAVQAGETFALSVMNK